MTYTNSLVISISVDACVSRVSLFYPCLVSCPLVNAHGTSHMCSTRETIDRSCKNRPRARDKNTLLTLLERLDSSNFLTLKLIHANVLTTFILRIYE